ncbi:MAG: hypothetical protein NT023_16210 [Armatimonadetes bacterium]|nr:hypothetical protein [Armatimonadota bacterium]
MCLKFNNLLTQERKNAEMSLYALAQETPISEVRLAQLEAGVMEVCERELYLLSRVFGWEMPSLFCAAGLEEHPFLSLTTYCQERYLQLMEVLEQVFAERPYVFRITIDENAKAVTEEAVFLDGSCGILLRNCRKEIRIKLPAYPGATQYITGESTIHEAFLAPVVTFSSLLRTVQWLDAK